MVGVNRFDFKVGGNILINGRPESDGRLRYYGLATQKSMKSLPDDQRDDSKRISEIIYKICKKAVPKNVYFDNALLEDVINEHPDLKDFEIFKYDKEGKLITYTNLNPKLGEFRDKILDGYEGNDGKGSLKKLRGNNTKFKYVPKPKGTIKISYEPENKEPRALKE